MFIDSLEVEENIRMSKNILDQDNGDKIEKELELVEQHEQKETFSLHLKHYFSEQKDDQTNNV